MAKRVVTSTSNPTCEPLFPASRVLPSAIVEAEQLQKQANSALSAARTEAHCLIEAAQGDIERRRQQAASECEALRLEARTEGQQQGLRQANTLLRELRRQIEQQQQQRQQELLQCALYLAEKIVGSELSHSADHLQRWAQQLREPLKGRADLQLFVHPDQLACFDEGTVSADSQLARHSLRLEFSGGEFSTGVQQRLRRMAESLGIGATDD